MRIPKWMLVRAMDSAVFLRWQGNHKEARILMEQVVKRVIYEGEKDGKRESEESDDEQEEEKEYGDEDGHLIR